MLFVDDATLISPKVLAVVYRRWTAAVRSPSRPTTARPSLPSAAEGFYVVAGHNPGVHGAVLSEALASRFAVQIHVQTDYDLVNGLKVDPWAERVARNLASRQRNGEVGWAPQLRELLAFKQVEALLGEDAAVQTASGSRRRRTGMWSPRSSAASSAAATARWRSAGRCRHAPAPAPSS